jgi:hypothetical protein
MHQPAPDAPHNPKLRARDALAAMEECPFDDDDHRELGHAAIVRHRAPDILIAYDNRPARDAQRLALAGNKEDQTDAGVLQHIVERIDPPVAAEWQASRRRDILRIRRDLPSARDQPSRADRSS